MIRRDFTSALQRSTEGKREADLVASTKDLDAQGERVDPEGIDLARYRANPVVLWGHNSYGMPIGSATDVRVEGGKLHAKVRFVDGAANPTAEMVYESVKQGALRGVSIGFKSLATTKGADDVIVHSRTELIEISLVAIGSNPAALITGVRSAGQPKPFRDLSLDEKIALFKSDPAGYEAARRARPTFAGKEWGDLTEEEKVTLYRVNRTLFFELMNSAIDDNHAA